MIVEVIFKRAWNKLEKRVWRWRRCFSGRVSTANPSPAEIKAAPNTLFSKTTPTRLVGNIVMSAFKKGGCLGSSKSREIPIPVDGWITI